MHLLWESRDCEVKYWAGRLLGSRTKCTVRREDVEVEWWDKYGATGSFVIMSRLHLFWVLLSSILRFEALCVLAHKTRISKISSTKLTRQRQMEKKICENVIFWTKLWFLDNLVHREYILPSALPTYCWLVLRELWFFPCYCQMFKLYSFLLIHFYFIISTATTFLINIASSDL